MLGLTAGTSALLLDAKGRSTVLLGLLSLFGLLCIYSMIQWMNVVIFPWDVYLGSGGRVSGSLGNPNLLGGMMAAFIPVAVGLLLGMEGRRPVRFTVMAVFCLLAILSIAASGTRGSLLGLASGLLFLAWFSLRRQAGGRRANLIIPLVALAAFLIIGFIMRERLLELSSLGEGTARVRLVIWSGAVALIAANPFLGYGPGTFQIIFPEVRNPMYSILGTSHNTLHAHCEYLEILVEVGLVGALLFVWIAVMVLGSSLRGRDGTRRKLGLADAGILAGIISLPRRGIRLGKPQVAPGGIPVRPALRPPARGRTGRTQTHPQDQRLPPRHPGSVHGSLGDRQLHDRDEVGSLPLHGQGPVPGQDRERTRPRGQRRGCLGADGG